MEFFGTGAFRHFKKSRNGKWAVFSNVCLHSPPDIPEVNDSFFHGTCLSNCYAMLEGGHFKVGLHRKGGSAHAPSGIWGCAHPGHALDRAPLVRSWSMKREDAMGPWDTPVAIRLPYKLQKFANGYTRMVIPYNTGTEVPLTHLRIEVWIHYEMYDNFRRLPDLWTQLLLGEKVACRGILNHPENLYRCGNSHRMTCGATVDRAAARSSGWKKAKSSGEWVCRCCRK